LKEQELDWSKVHRIMDFIELDTKEYFGNAKNFKDLKSLVRNNDNVELMDKYIKSLENINTLKDELTEAHKLIKELQEELTRAKNES
jgi:trimethylamine:corrinoid methyltransferase-like protein